MTDIEQARTILTKWGEGVTPGPWKMHQDKYAFGDDEWDVVVAEQRAFNGVRSIRSDGSYAEDSGYMTKPDATLIVAMTDPALREALDGLLAFSQQDYIGWYGPEPRAEDDGEPEPYFPFVESIAAVIIAIDQRMNA